MKDTAARPVNITPLLMHSRETGSAGDAERAEAAELWGMIAEHFVGETTIAGYDVMNEVTGSPGDILQIAMYNAIRAKDPNRLLIVSRLGLVA